ncbi:MAG: excinuclease ABC subunit UvrA [Alphaproteobacteria bacterium]
MAGRIVIHGARVHNLKNIDVEIPRERLVVVTGVSGSGKTSLAFDTLYAEGQRRYLESLSADARQRLQPMERPDVEHIEGLSPAIAIQPKTGIFSPRSTVGTLTEIYDYLRLLYARAGQPTCIQCGRPVVSYATEQIVDELFSLSGPARIVILAPIKLDGREASETLAELARAGFTRVLINGEIEQLSEEVHAKSNRAGAIHLIVDRLVVREGVEKRLADSIEIAARYGSGVVKIEVAREENSEPLEMIFSQTLTCARCAIAIPEIEPRLFSFNSPIGACPVCGGMGFIAKASRRAGGADAEQATELCNQCHGSRLRPESLTVKLGGKSIAEAASLTTKEALIFFSAIELAGKHANVGKRVLDEIICRLRFLGEVGLNYLSLSRSARSLSGGEAQRVRLATQVGSNLAGVLYILDEPSIGLHQSDNARLIALLKQLRDRGNSVIVVEHDPETILAADYIIDMGPGAGVHGGEVVAHGTPAEIVRRSDSLTGQYLSGRAQIAVAADRRKGSASLVITGAREHNLKNVTAEFPIGILTCVTGVSGAGKSSLVMDTLYPALAARLRHISGGAEPFEDLRGWEHFDRIIAVDQSPIGRSPRSNPATYTGIYDDIRILFAQLPEARVRGYKAARFSFNASGGRCEACRGDGVLRVDMYFLPDVFVTCDLCKGKRYNRETLEIRYKGLSIADVLDLTVNQAAELLNHFPSIHERLLTLREVGLGYIRLGQAASTLSGGEAQRVKLARELARRSTGRSLYILDEPTTGLHFEDVKKLLDLVSRLTALGNTIIVIEHNLDVIKAADYVIDLGPGAGAQGGEIVAQGTPEHVASVADSLTGFYLRARLAQKL